MKISPLRPISRSENQAHDITCSHLSAISFLEGHKAYELVLMLQAKRDSHIEGPC
jgi:hypothetical protein